MRELGKHDVFFLLVFILGRNDANNDFVFDRVEDLSLDDTLNLWSRAHYKSTIITFACVIQEILRNPDVKVGIFSYNRPTAKAFLRQIKNEMEQNETLKSLFDDVLYGDPKRESPTWSEDNGIVVKRFTNPKESTVSAYGLVDSQPTGMHFTLMVYDDVVTQDSVTTQDTIDKTTRAWELSMNLGSNGIERIWYVGTRYHFADTYKVMMDRGIKTVIVPATIDGTTDGDPVFLSKTELAKKRRIMGPKTFASQMLLDPREESNDTFSESWIRYWPGIEYNNLNIYIICDPAHSKKKGSDWTVFWVIGLGADKNYYVLNMIRDRVNLTEKGNILFRLHQMYDPINVGYEKYGMQSDVEYFRDRMSRDNYRFGITELGGTKIAKEDRIRRLFPIFEDQRIYLPERMPYTNYEGKRKNMTEVFIQEEYLTFPFAEHDDMLDSLSRILDTGLNATFPSGTPHSTLKQWEVEDELYDPLTFGF